MLTASRFNEEDLTGQIIFLKFHGQYVSERTEGPYTITLYQIKDFYVEKYYKGKELSHFKAFIEVYNLD